MHKEKNALYSTEKISFSDKISFGDSPFSLWLKSGKSSFKYEKREEYRHKIVLYKVYFGNYKAKIEYHFFNKKLFFITYSFPELKDPEKVINMIKKKYKIDASIDLETSKIIDANNNILYLDTSLEFTINYFTGDKFIVDSIEGKLIDIVKNIKQKELLSDRILFENL